VRVIENPTVEVPKCPKCGSTNVAIGPGDGKERLWYCLDCRKPFVVKDTLEAGR
jgi:transposase-like protein